VQGQKDADEDAPFVPDVKKSEPSASSTKSTSPKHPLFRRAVARTSALAQKRLEGDLRTTQAQRMWMRTRNRVTQTRVRLVQISTMSPSSGGEFDAAPFVPEVTRTSHTIIRTRNVSSLKHPLLRRAAARTWHLRKKMLEEEARTAPNMRMWMRTRSRPRLNSARACLMLLWEDKPAVVESRRSVRFQRFRVANSLKMLLKRICKSICCLICCLEHPSSGSGASKGTGSIFALRRNS
jgi:hypothetical protein